MTLLLSVASDPQAAGTVGFLIGFIVGAALVFALLDGGNGNGW